MSRFYVPEESLRGDDIVITGKEAHHILDVMRLKKSDEVIAFDGTGKEYVGFIKEAKRGRLLVEITETRSPPKKKNSLVTLIQAVPKKERMDYIVEKATELGVHSIIPVITDRTIVKWDGDKKIAVVERWRRIARESAKQCGRSDLPKIATVMAFSEAIEAPDHHDLRLMAALSDEAIGLKEVLSGFRPDSIAVAIGPEGDFSPDEVKTAKGSGFKVVTLGPMVLRSDTAGSAVLAILNYELSRG